MSEILQSTENTVQTSGNVMLNQLIDLCIEKEASDIHFREGGRADLRVRGQIIFIENTDKLSKEDVEAIIRTIIPGEYEINRLKNNKEVDFAYIHKNGVNFRVNLFYQKGKMAGVMRMIPKNIPDFNTLGVPEIVKNFVNLKEGLIVTCGNAGSGKSTTVQSMLEYINQNSVRHILTVENPIEYAFEDKKSMFTQREIGKDTLRSIDALRSAFREDINVIMVSDIVDFDTLDSIFNLVETGHLVIVSITAKDSVQAVERMVSIYPNEMRQYAQNRLAVNLTAVLAQDLAEKKDKSGLVPVFELMITNQNIQKIIKSGNFIQIKNAIQLSENEGMISMERYIQMLAEQGIIS